MSEALTVQMQSIQKTYPDGTTALKNVHFDLRRGEIHGLLGENGAGKSTLTKILSGLLRPTQGQIHVRGRMKVFRSPADALHAGIGMVHQHFALVSTFTALENIVLGQRNKNLFSKLQLSEVRAQVENVMHESGFVAPLDVPVESLPVGVQQRIEIIKTLYRQVDVLILDEPTSVLTPVEVNEFFKVLRALRNAGKSIILITHKLKEILDVTDRVTVLRQGQNAGQIETKDATPEILARMMVGHDVLSSIQKKAAQPGQAILKIAQLEVKDNLDLPAVQNLSFEVRTGEILGIAGVEGNGQTELVEAITGLRSVSQGTIFFNEKNIVGLDPRQLYRDGLAHIPEDRRRIGMVLEFSIAENSILGVHHERRFHGFWGKLLWIKVRQYTREIIQKFSIVASDVQAPAKSLSGGNQQKLVCGREFEKHPSLIVAAQPTRGLDISATQYIRDQLVKLRDEGKAILLVSADLDEIYHLSDRIAVIYEGQFMGIAPPSELDRGRIGLMMGGLKSSETKPQLSETVR
jgi:simple sugar transport system ATP-binding protein